MKKRIISFLLALVLVFSCLSLNAFAAGAVLAETEKIDFQTEVTEPMDAAKYQQYGIGLEGNYNLSADQIKDVVGTANILTNSAIIEQTTTGTSDGAYIGKYAGLAAGFYKVERLGFETIKTVNDGNGNWYIKWDTTPADTQIDVTQATTTERLEMDLGATKKIDASTYEALKDKLGAPYAITFDFMNWGTYGTYKDGLLETTRAYINGTAINTYYDFRVSTDGELQIYDGAASKWVSTGKTLPLDNFVQITIYHTPRGLNGIREVDENGQCYGDDNTYHVFVDGEYLITAGAVSKTETKNYTVGTATVNSASDFLLQMFHFGRRELTGVAIDDFRIYYGDFVECKHSWTYSHSHDVENTANVLTATCEWCGKTETANVNKAENPKLTAEEIEQATGVTVMVNNNFENLELDHITKAGETYPFFRPDGTTKDSKFAWYNKAGLKLIVNKTDKTGNTYLKWQSPTYDTTDEPYDTNEARSGEYIRHENAIYNKTNMTSKIATYVESGVLGQSYAITFDFINYGNVSTSELISGRSFTGSAYDAVWAKYNFKIEADGSFIFSGVSVYDAPIGEAVQLTIYHTPRGLNGVKDTTVTDNGDGTFTYTNTADYDDNTYHVFINGEHKGSFTAVDAPTNYYDSAKGIHYNSASDFTPAFIDFGQIYTKVNVDHFAIDDYRIYYGNFLECAHTDIIDGVCKYCKETVIPGYHCDICAREVKYSGIALDKDVAVTDRSVSLGDEINMNVYFELSEVAKADASTLVRLTGADGKRISEIPLADLTLMTEGNAAGRYKATLPLRSIDMAREVKAELVKGGEAYGTVYTTSVEDYLKAVIAIDENAKALAEATLNYGAYAQKYFAVKNENSALDDVLPNGGITDNVATAEPIFGTDADISVSDGNTINFTYASLVLSNTTKINLYFKVSADAVVTMGEKTIAKQFCEETEDYFVTLEGALPNEFDEAYTITVTDGSYSGTVTLSVNSVLKLVMEGTDAAEDAEYQNLVKALYLYSVEAERYEA